MQISRQTDYAVRTMEFLARIPAGVLVQTREIARKQDIPEKYLPSIVRTLATAGLLKTMRGNHGGIRLARPPEDITLKDIVEAIDGPVILNRCQIKPGECESSNSNRCTLHRFWERVTADVQRQLSAVSIGDLVNGEGVQSGGGDLLFPAADDGESDAARYQQTSDCCDSKKL